MLFNMQLCILRMMHFSITAAIITIYPSLMGIHLMTGGALAHLLLYFPMALYRCPRLISSGRIVMAVDNFNFCTIKFFVKLGNLIAPRPFFPAVSPPAYPTRLCHPSSGTLPLVYFHSRYCRSVLPVADYLLLGFM
jgi:hypothetical protein